LGLDRRLDPPAGLSSPRQRLDIKIYLPRRPPLMRLRWTAHLCNTIGHSVSAEAAMRQQPYDGQTLFGPSGNRKYLNATERRRFLESAQQLPKPERLFCQVLAWTGARISEALALTPASIDIESGVASITTLKRRKRGIVRQVPLPSDVLDELDREFSLHDAQRHLELANKRIWTWSRTTAWRRVKELMAVAGIAGTPAMPKGLYYATRLA
jgi:integrase/recombinase XerD